MKEIILILIASYGICFALQHKLKFLHGKIGWIDKMFECTFCTGFHAGWIAYLLYYTNTPQQIEPKKLLLFALASSAFCYALDELIKSIERS